MNVAIVQHDIAWGAPTEHRDRSVDANLSHIGQMLDAQPGADLYVLAETFATGFMPTDGGSHGRIVDWMKEQAATRGAALAGSVALTDADGLRRNRLLFVRPDGTCDCYDKHHLFTYADEHRHYAAGTERVVAGWRGVRFMLQVCYDLRFPVWSRNCPGPEGYDALIYVANWPESRAEAWDTLLRARAIENQCFVIGVNRVGDDPTCHYSGRSAIIDAYGRTLCSCQPDVEQTASATLDMARLNRFREKFPVLADADNDIQEYFEQKLKTNQL